LRRLVDADQKLILWQDLRDREELVLEDIGRLPCVDFERKRRELPPDRDVHGPARRRVGSLCRHPAGASGLFRIDPGGVRAAVDLHARFCIAAASAAQEHHSPARAGRVLLRRCAPAPERASLPAGAAPCPRQIVRAGPRHSGARQLLAAKAGHPRP